MSFSSYRLFVSRCIKKPFSVGALAPSSVCLGREMTRFLVPGEGRHFLELGPGTGAFTAAVLKKLGPSDRLDLVESDSDFCAYLRQQHRDDSRVTVHEASIVDWDSSLRYDGILSGLPLVLFTPEAVQLLFEKLQRLVSETGFLSYFEYLLLPSLRQCLLSGESRRRIEGVLSAKSAFMDRFLYDSSIVWRNFPPARVLHFRNRWDSCRSS